MTSKSLTLSLYPKSQRVIQSQRSLNVPWMEKSVVLSNPSQHVRMCEGQQCAREAEVSLKCPPTNHVRSPILCDGYVILLADNHKKYDGFIKI